MSQFQDSKSIILIKCPNRACCPSYFILMFIICLFSVKLREVSRRVKKQSDESPSLISLDQHTAKQLRYFRYTVTAFIVQILSDKRFISKVRG